MTHWPERNDASSEGFTLLELLVTLAILALIAAMVLPALSSSPDRMRLRTAAREVAAALRQARSLAIVRGGEVAVAIDVDKRSIEPEGLPAVHLGSDIAVRLTIAEPEREAPARGGFRFFADGSSTGGDIVLRLGERELHLCVDWLIGRALQGSNC